MIKSVAIPRPNPRNTTQLSNNTAHKIIAEEFSFEKFPSLYMAFGNSIESSFLRMYIVAKKSTARKIFASTMEFKPNAKPIAPLETKIPSCLKV